ncbi:MAG: TIR domain-containing protein [Phototrophicaceae bacterium]
MKNIFISFSQRDNRYMATMRENLIRIGYKPWIDPKPRPGQDWRFEIDDAIRSADAVLVIVSPAAAESVYVTYEWSLAIGLDVPVIPVIFSKAKMHPRLHMLEHFDFTSFTSEPQFWDYFNREIKRILSDIAQPSEPMKPMQLQQQLAPAAGNPVFTRQVMPTTPGHYLVIRRGPGLNAIHSLNKNVITLGRDNTNDITIDDPEVSRYHLRLSWNANTNTYVAEDLGSTNGTRINGGSRITDPTPLYPGQALMLGDTIIVSYEVVN